MMIKALKSHFARSRPVKDSSFSQNWGVNMGGMMKNQAIEGQFDFPTAPTSVRLAPLLGIAIFH
jgi:hypothetical protein